DRAHENSLIWYDDGKEAKLSLGKDRQQQICLVKDSFGVAPSESNPRVQGGVMCHWRDGEVVIMDIDLRLPSGEQDKEEDEPNGIENVLVEEKLHNGDVETGNIDEIADEVRTIESGDVNSPTGIMVFKEDTNLEPLSGMEFESHGAAYSFYQEYARSMGFNTAIQNSRRSKTSREFIDAKFACSRYGTKREYDKSFNRPRARQSKQDPENGTGRRSCSKTDCKASMHVKRRPDGKWVIHSFIKEHNHELLPAQAVSEQTRKMYAAMARQFAEYKNVIGLKNDPKNPFDKGRSYMNTRYILKRWTKDAKSRHLLGVESEQIQSRVQRYNDLCQRALKLSEEASLSQESYNIAFRAIEEASGNCIRVNNSSKSLAEAGTSISHGMLCIEEDSQSRSINKSTKKKNPTKKRKEKLTSRVVTMDNFYGTQQSVPNMVQLNLMAPTRDNYYGNQQTIQGLDRRNPASR
ncbi:hypothetical protein Tsubulata_005159, partial [Turnera subulata]